MPRVLIDASAIANDTVSISGSEARHLIRVLRVTVGAPLTAFDGDGHEWEAHVRAVGASRLELTLGPRRTVDRESPLRVTLAVGLTRGQRLDDVVRMATELGVAEVQPLRTGRTVPSGEGDNRLRRWRRIAREACKQCGRNAEPRIAASRELTDFLQDHRPTDVRLLFFEGGGAPLDDALDPRPGAGGTATLVIGPEGGLTPDEVEAADAADFRRVGLGPRILRADNAAVTALAAVQLLWGDLGGGR